MHKVLLAGAAGQAYELFEEGIETLLRYHSYGHQVTKSRQELLVTLLNLVDGLSRATEVL